jgi:hypothetical protein
MGLGSGGGGMEEVKVRAATGGGMQDKLNLELSGYLIAFNPPRLMNPRRCCVQQVGSW